ncbi:hypothetical protein CHARACLAT_028586, partial [Characodon lateralis]|nr:hypothetical protein [Characodon lateralis]
ASAYWSAVPVEVQDWSGCAIRQGTRNITTTVCKMPTSPVKTRIPLTSIGLLITEVKKQLFGIKEPLSVQLAGWRKHFNSYTLQGRRNVHNLPNCST